MQTDSLPTGRLFLFTEVNWYHMAPQNESNDIIIDIPFITAQVISVAANQTGHNYIQVIVFNIILLLAAKLVFIIIKFFKKL